MNRSKALEEQVEAVSGMLIYATQTFGGLFNVFILELFLFQSSPGNVSYKFILGVDILAKIF